MAKSRERVWRGFLRAPETRVKIDKFSRCFIPGLGREQSSLFLTNRSRTCRNNRNKWQTRFETRIEKPENWGKRKKNITSEFVLQEWKRASVSELIGNIVVLCCQYDFPYRRVFINCYDWRNKNVEEWKRKSVASIVGSSTLLRLIFCRFLCLYFARVCREQLNAILRIDEKTRTKKNQVFFFASQHFHVLAKLVKEQCANVSRTRRWRWGRTAKNSIFFVIIFVFFHQIEFCPKQRDL